MCRSCFYKTPNPPLRKADHLGLAIGDMVFGLLLGIAIIMLGQKNEFKFQCELGWFLQRQSHIYYIYTLASVRTCPMALYVCHIANCMLYMVIPYKLFSYLGCTG